MKKIFTAAIFFILLLTGCGKKSDKEVRVYNFGEYIDPQILKDFEKETGIHVVYDTYEITEDLYVKIKKGSLNVDVIVPSDYMIERLRKENMLEKIDFSNVPNIKNIDERLHKAPYDPTGEYSVPYFWGTMGICYNKKKIQDKMDSWDVLWNEKYKGNILMLDSSRDSIGIALKKSGYSMNSRNLKELEKAKELLVSQKPLVHSYLLDGMVDAMTGNESDIAVMYSGYAYAAMRENADLEYVIPKEGSQIWEDSIAIIKGAKNKENAEKFINYMLDAEVAAKNASFVGAPTPNLEARKLLPEAERNSKVLYPDLDKVPPLEALKDPEDIISTYDSIWSDVKVKN